jgi:type IV secretion system protein VirB9
MSRILRSIVAAVPMLNVALTAPAETLPIRGPADARVRTAVYDGAEVYRLHGQVGYQIDLQFERGEEFVGLGAGDIEGLSFVAQDNHLFLKPRAAKVETNLTVLTNRRHYQIDYTAASRRPGRDAEDVIYALQFTYPPSANERDAQSRIEAGLDRAEGGRPRNIDYWYCGHPELKPVAASDDGVHTRLRFGGRAELPAVFVKNDDGTESLLNFSMDAGDVVIHRVARRFILRRGALTACVVNKGYLGSGERLETGTVTPQVLRAAPGARP